MVINVVIPLILALTVLVTIVYNSGNGDERSLTIHCERISAPEEKSGPAITLPSKATEVQWSVVCRSMKRMKVSKAPLLEGSQVETKNLFIIMKGVTKEEVDVAR